MSVKLDRRARRRSHVQSGEPYKGQRTADDDVVIKGFHEFDSNDKPQEEGAQWGDRNDAAACWSLQCLRETPRKIPSNTARFLGFG